MYVASSLKRNMPIAFALPHIVRYGNWKVSTRESVLLHVLHNTRHFRKSHSKLKHIFTFWFQSVCCRTQCCLMVCLGCVCCKPKTD